MSLSRPFLAGLLACWLSGCAGPIVCPDGRDVEGVACVCPADTVSLDDTCVSRAAGGAPGAPLSGAGDERDRGADVEVSDVSVREMHDAAVGLDASPAAAREAFCPADAGCGDAAVFDGSTAALSRS